MGSKAMIAIIILVIIGGGIWYMQSAGTTPEPATVPAPEQAASGTVAQEPAVTGKVDDILSSFDEEEAQEAAARTAGDADADTALSDGGVINDLSQTYDETTL